MNLELEIEELVLQGFSAAERERISQAVQRELERLFAQEGVPRSLEGGGDMASLDGAALRTEPGSSPESIGVQVARALYEGVSRL